MTQRLEALNREDSYTNQLRKVMASLERKAQLYMRELMMAKVITDFLIQMHLATGVTSSCRVRELTHELLPFAMTMHEDMSGSLTKALNIMVKSHLPDSMKNMLNLENKNKFILAGFVVA